MTRDAAEATAPENIWEGMVDDHGTPFEPPEGDETAVTADERRALDVDEFWQARRVLRHLHDFARSQRVGPWAVLGTALARVIAQVTPEVQLPNTIGSFASLNLFVGLVGYSGDGKDAAQAVAGDALHIEHPRFTVSPLGSGEGLSHMFMRQKRATKTDPHPEPEQYNDAALVNVGEIDSMAALVQRQSSTVAAQLRQAAMGQQLGFFYADTSRRMIVPEHSYRLCLIAGIQPERSGILLDDAGGGTPQRFVWLPAGDPGAPYIVPAPPLPMIWNPPDWAFCERAHSHGEIRFLISLPEVVRRTIIETRVGRLRGEGEQLDSHAVLTRTKVAATLAIVEGRTVVNTEDWELSGVIMAVSDTQRARCLRVLEREREKVNVGRALAEAERGLVVEERIDRVKVAKCVESVSRLLRQHGGLPGAELRRRLNAAYREHLDAALDALSITGEVVGEEVSYKGQTGVRYKIAES